MSTILNALRRLEADKRREAAPEPLHDRVVGPGDVAPRPVRRAMLWAAGSGLLVVAVVAGGLLALGLAPRLDALRGGASIEQTGGEEAGVAVAGGSVAAAGVQGASGAPAEQPAPTAATSTPRAAGPAVGAAAAAQASAGSTAATVPPVAAGGPPAPSTRAGAAPGAGVPRAGSLAPTRREARRPVGAGPAPRAGSQAAPQGGFASAAPETVENLRPISMLPLADPTETSSPVAPTRVAAAADRRAREAASGGDGGVQEASWRTSRTSASDATPSAGRGASAGSGADTPRVTGRARELSIVKIVWHPHAARRIAEVSVAGEARPREVHEGDRVEGLEVREIKLSSVVFERDGVQVERRVSGRRP